MVVFPSKLISACHQVNAICSFGNRSHDDGHGAKEKIQVAVKIRLPN